MPNYVRNIIQMKGIASLPLFSENTDGKKNFDFNKLIPMPESLKVECGSMTEESIIYYLTDRLTLSLEELDEEKAGLVKALVHNMFDQHWPQTVYGRLQKDQQNMSQGDKNRMFKSGIKYIENYQKYGAVSWYEWCNREWGTKWNAGDTEIIGEDKVIFDTAWDNPEPVILKLAEMYPQAKIEHWWADEDVGSNTGYHCIEGGTIVTQTPESGSAEALGFYSLCWGYVPE